MSQSRREFLKRAFGSCALLSLGRNVPAVFARAARAIAAGQGRPDRVLVVLQLSGGNDGLNTVVPYADDHYARNRRTLRLSGRQVHKIDSYLGFHPEMQGLARLFKEGRLSVVQGVGYPHSDRTHPGAMRNWHTGRPDEPNCPTGWLGRGIDRLWHPAGGRARLAREGDLPGVFVGRIARPFALNAQKAVVPSLRSAEDLTLKPWAEEAILPWRPEPAPKKQPANHDNPLAEIVRRSTVAAHATSRHLRAVLADSGTAADYPPFQLAKALSTVAQLIRADVGIRIFMVELGGGGIGGFDNHANQRDNHAALLRQLSESVTALADDLASDGQLDRVVLMTFSEFGRTLAENGRRGTGHGAAQPIFLVGGRLKGGLAGEHPSLGDLDQGAPKFHTDFRRLYATVLASWLGLDSTAVLGRRFETLDVLDA